LQTDIGLPSIDGDGVEGASEEVAGISVVVASSEVVAGTSVVVVVVP